MNSKTHGRKGEWREERHGVVAVCLRESRFLVIRRSQFVEAPGAFCFPGGAVEPGEDEPTALLRELREELHCEFAAVHRLWQSRTEWNVNLAWWLVSLDEAKPVPNPREVESVHWLTADEMRTNPQLLTSNLAFLAAIDAGEIVLP